MGRKGTQILEAGAEAETKEGIKVDTKEKILIN